MLKITAPRLVKNLREDVDWMDCISRQEDDFTECSFNGLCVEDVSKQNLSVNSCLFTNCGFIACNYRKSQFSDGVFKNCDLSNINLSGCGFYRVEFIGCKLTGTNFSESIFNHTTIRDCKGDYVIFSMSKLRNVSFNQCFLRGGGLDNCQFTNVEFEHCNLVEAELHRTSLKGIDLTSSEIAGIRIGSIPGGELKGATVTSLQALDIARMLGITIKD